MVIVSFAPTFTKLDQELESRKDNLSIILNQLQCPNKCKKDMLVRIWSDKRKGVIGDPYGPCCPEFEREMRPYLK
jgi:hypothetical protein